MLLQINKYPQQNYFFNVKKNKTNQNITFKSSIKTDDIFVPSNKSLSENIEKAFGKNDIRGIYGKEITEDLFYLTAKGYISYILKELNKNSEKKFKPDDLWISVSQDARTHSPSLTNSLIKGITSTGANVLNLGMVPTPLGYYSEFIKIPKNIIPQEKINGAMIVTASHNPKEYNGLKMTFNQKSLNAQQIEEIKQQTKSLISNKKEIVKKGTVKEFNIIQNYQNNLIKKFKDIGKNIKILTDCGNATAGVVAPQLYKDLGCEVVELFSEPDGNFPNHHPNPSDDKTLDSLKKAVIQNNADIGIAFDGDSDRIGVVDSNGNSLTGDKLLFIFAQDIILPLVKRGEVPNIVSEVKCSQVLYDKINELGGNAIMTKTGHGYIKSKMKETNAILAGEMSGHTFFKDRYYGFDDAIYAGCRIIEIIAKNKLINPEFKIEDLLKYFNKIHSSKEIRFNCPNKYKKLVLDEIKEKIEKNPNLFGSKIKEIVTIDGMRINFEDGFALIRQSNTEPVLTLRFESKSKQNCEKYEKISLKLLEKIIEKHK